jgi:branched-chain amino acid transport system substrate-binding protein
MKFKDWSLAVLQGATDPHLPELLRRKDRPACQGFLEGVRETFDDPARGLVRRGERPPFSSWFLIDESGVLIACTPDRVLIGQDMSGREWYQGAVAHTGKRWLDSVHVSRVFFSVVTENLSKSALSVPVYKGNEPDSPMIGVLGVSFTTSPDLGLSRLHDERHKVLVAGRWDPQSYGGYSPEDDHLVLVHPAYRRGEEAVKVSAPSLRNFRPSPESGELRPPEPGQVPVVDEEFKDPLAEGPRWAGIAPVGNTPFLAILEQRPDPLIEREAPIVVGQMVDLTGVTSYVSEPYAKGAQAYVDWLNAQGGINRKKVRLVRIDYRYQHVEALEIYERLKTVHQVLAIQGWGTGDSQMLTARVTQDRIPFLSASSSAQLTDPRKTPYNFILTADYSSQLRAALRFLRESWKRPRKPRLAFIYPDHPYGKSPIPAGMDYARELGFDVVGEQIVNLEATEATAEIRYFKNREPDFTWIGGTTPSTALILKEARKQDLQTRFFVNLWGNDESLIQRAGLAAEGVLGLQPSVLFGDDVPGMRALREAMRGEPGVTHGVRGWVSMMVLCEALRRADASGELTGPGIKRALETLCEFDPQGLLPSVTYTPNDHRPSTAVRIYEFSGGRMCHRAVVEAERRMEWLGV